jgi:hypothetical protein
VRKDPKAVKRLIGVQLQSSAFFSGLNLVGISVWLVASAAIAARLFRWEVT